MFLVISLLCLFISYRLFRYASGSMRITEINMISWIFYIHLFLMSFIGSLLIVYSIDNHYVINSLSRDSVRFWGWASVMYTMIALPSGMCLSAIFFHVSPRKCFHNYLSNPVTPYLSEKDSYIKFPLYAFSFIAFLAIAYTFFYADSFPLLEVFRGSTSESLAQTRISISRNFKGNQYVRNILGLQLAPVLTYIAYAYWKMTRSKKDLLWFFMLFFTSFLAMTYNLAKAPFIIFLLGLFFEDILISGKRSLKSIYLFLLALIIIFILFYVFFTKYNIITILFQYNQGITGRVILGQIAGLFKSLEYFPMDVDFIGFSSLSNFISHFFNYEYTERSARTIMSLFNPRGIEQGTAGVMNSLFIAEAWANWGIAGILISPLWVGFLIETVYLFLLKGAKTPVFLGALALLSVKWPITGGVNDFIYSPMLLLTLIFVVFFIFSGLMLKGAQKKTDIR